MDEQCARGANLIGVMPLCQKRGRGSERLKTINFSTPLCRLEKLKAFLDW